MNLLFLSVGLLVLYAYRRGLQDASALKKGEDLSPRVLKKSPSPKTEEELDWIRQYEEMMSYDFEQAGEADEQH